ncbi:AMP-binding protein, partial [Nocardia sp. R7R-8]|uniref:AMP-binding protein n=1 Tax=Nocardia sp. R7R-8 TaxID=3459304 RepID=UPI00403DD6FA
MWMQSRCDLGPQDTILHKTPLTFDVSVWELFAPAVTGSCLVLAEPEGHRDPGYLAEVITRRDVTVIHFVPSMLNHFLAAETITGGTSLRLVVASGEVLPADLAGRVVRGLGVRLLNLYGPTEATVDV